MRIGLIGCGTTGRRIGLRILRSGRSLAVHDLDPRQASVLLDAGATWADSPASLGSAADLVVSALPRAEDVHRACVAKGGLWDRLDRGSIHVETSTLGPDRVRELAEAARARRLRFLDAPLSRGASRESGPDIVIYVGGETDTFDLARPVLDAFAHRTVYCGGTGQGQVAKVVNNLVTHVLTVVTGEALALGVRAGGSVDLLRNALHEGTAQSRVLDDLLPVSLLRGDWRPGLRLDLARRDLDLAEEISEESGVKPALLDRVRHLYDAAATRGWSDLSAHAVLRLVEEAWGVELRSPILQALSRPDDPSRRGRGNG